MGLDNGILATISNEKEYKTLVKKYKQLYPNTFEICYWRKHWHLRDEFMNALISKMPESELNNGEIELTATDLYLLYLIFKRYMQRPQERGFEEKELYRFNKKNLKNLRKMVKLKKKYPSIEIIFYDSY